MNFTQSLFNFYWKAMEFINPERHPAMFQWAVDKQIFSEETKRYQNLRTSLMGGDLSTPIGVVSDLGISEGTVDALIQQGAGFGTFGSYIYRNNADHRQTLFYRRGAKTHVDVKNYEQNTIGNAEKKLSQRRHLPHFIGISISSYLSEEMKIGDGEQIPGYIYELQLLTQKAAPLCDYLVINVSHPLSPVVPMLADESTMIPLIQRVQETAQIAAPISTPKIVLKVPFNVSEIEVKAISQISLKTGIDGIIISGHAAVTKKSPYVDTKSIELLDGAAMVSGEPLRKNMIHLIKDFRKRTHGLIPLIASDVLMTGEDVFDFLAAGASAVEAGVVCFFEGPQAIQKLNMELSAIMRKKGIRQVVDIIGMNAPLDPNVTAQDLFN